MASAKLTRRRWLRDMWTLWQKEASVTDKQVALVEKAFQHRFQAGWSWLCGVVGFAKQLDTAVETSVHHWVHGQWYIFCRGVASAKRFRAAIKMDRNRCLGLHFIAFAGVISVQVNALQLAVCFSVIMCVRLSC